MHSLSSSLGTGRFAAYADEAAAGLRRDPATRHLVEALDGKIRALDKALESRVAVERVLGRARAELRVQSEHLEQAMSSLQKTIVIETHSSASELEREVFPSGLAPPRVARGEKKLALALEVVRRLSSSGSEGAEVVRQAFLGRITPEVEAFRQTVQAVVDAKEVVRERRLDEVKAREDLARVLAQTDGQLRVLFPRNRRRRDVFQPLMKSGRSRRAGVAVIEPEDEEEPRGSCPRRPAGLPSGNSASWHERRSRPSRAPSSSRASRSTPRCSPSRKRSRA